MSTQEPATPPQWPLTNPQLEQFLEHLLQAAVARLEQNASSPHIGNKECAKLIGVTPEHLCAMRSRGEGPPWSGSGKWVRYRRRGALEWLDNLPRGDRNTGDASFKISSGMEDEQ